MDQSPIQLIGIVASVDRYYQVHIPLGHAFRVATPILQKIQKIDFKDKNAKKPENLYPFFHAGERCCFEDDLLLFESTAKPFVNCIVL